MKRLMQFILINNFDRHLFFGMLISKIVLLANFGGVNLGLKIFILAFVNLCIGILWEWLEGHYFEAKFSKLDVLFTILGLFLALWL